MATIIRRMQFLGGLLALAHWTYADVEPLEKSFRQPSGDALTGVWWHWMGSNVSAKGITRDLEEFQKAGIGAATIFGMADVCAPWAAHIDNSPTKELIAFTDPWWKLVRHAAAEGKRLGIDVGIHNCPGYTSTGGPWVTPELAMQQIFASRTDLDGGASFDGILPKAQVDPRGDMLFPMVNRETGALEKPIIPSRTTYWRDIVVLAVPAEGIISKDQIINLTEKMDAAGHLQWTAPAGVKWSIYRFGHTTMGALTQPNQWEVMGLECDKMSEKAISFHLDHVLGKLRQHLGDLLGSGLRHVLLDSYEAGTPSWTPLMPQEFEKRRGYSLIAFLPTLVNRVVASDAETAQFRRDFEKTIADLYRDVLFRVMAQKLEKENLRFVCEPYGGPFITADVAPRVHRVMTEFWSSDGFHIDVQDGITNGANGQHHNILEAEAFTGAPGNSMWNETPHRLKNIGDAAYLAGVNRFILHSNPHQPWGERYRPGISMGQWGTHFGRTQTWWEPGKAWLSYLNRCQAVLQWGRRASKQQVSFLTTEGNASPMAVHRTDGEHHAFFVAIPSQQQGKVIARFVVGKKMPELWDPVTGVIRELTDYRVEGEAVRVALEFAPGQSHAIIFRKAAQKPNTDRKNFPHAQELVTLEGPWRVSFDPKWGGPRVAATWEFLMDWTHNADPGIKYYSGTAVYRKRFDLKQRPNADGFLDIGTVYHLAQVRLNGQQLGVVWCAPWRVSIPASLLKAQGNELEIAVTNVWANRLIGDEQHPDDCEWNPGFFPGTGKYLKRFPDWFVKGQNRPSKQRYAFATWNYFHKDSALTPSGLIGPVRIMDADWRQSETSVPNFVMSKTSTTPGVVDGLESQLPAIDEYLTIAELIEQGIPPSPDGAKDAGALFNRTTLNGEGQPSTQDDGKTYRGFGAGQSLTMKISAAESLRLVALETFAAHTDARASQAYRVLVAKANQPEHFEMLTDAQVFCQGGATKMRIPIKAKNVVAIRLEFFNGPSGFNVYREICLVGKK